MKDAILVFVVAALIQLGYLNCAPLIAHYDSVNYLRAAFGILDYGNLSQMEPVRTPGYPLFLAAILAIAGGSGFAVAVVQHLLYATLAGLLTYLSTGLVRRSHSVVLGLLVAIDPVMALYGNWLLAEIPFTFCLTVATLLFLRAPLHFRQCVTAGAFFGLATLFRPNGLLAFIAVLLMLGLSALLKRISRQNVIRSASALTLGVALFVGPWVVYRYLAIGEIGLARNQSGFLRVQMLQEQRLFNPALLNDSHLVSYYHELVAQRQQDDDETKRFRRGFAFVFRDEVMKTRDEFETEEFYRAYLERYLKTNSGAYAQQASKHFLSLMHISGSDQMTPLAANRYLGDFVPYEKQISFITDNKREYDALYHPHEYNATRGAWQRKIHLMQTIRPFLGMTLLLLFALALMRVLKRKDLNPLLLTPYVVLILQAAAYAYLLHHDDRYTYVLNPLLILQAALFLVHLNDKLRPEIEQLQTQV